MQQAYEEGKAVPRPGAPVLVWLAGMREALSARTRSGTAAGDRLPTRRELLELVAWQRHVIDLLAQDRARLAGLAAQYAVELEGRR